MAISSLKKAKTVGKHVVAKEDGVDFVPFAVCPMVLLVFVVIQDLMEAVQLEWSKLFVILTSGTLSIIYSKIRLESRLENFVLELDFEIGKDLRITTSVLFQKLWMIM